MTLLATTVGSLLLLAPLGAQPPEGAGSGSQTITITRAGSQPSGKGPAENFSGSVRVDYLFLRSATNSTCGTERRMSGMSHPIS